jgi:hypothetical protein
VTRRRCAVTPAKQDAILVGMSFWDDLTSGSWNEATRGYVDRAVAQTSISAYGTEQQLRAFERTTAEKQARLEHAIKVQQAMIASLADLLIKARVVDAEDLRVAFERMVEQLLPPPPVAEKRDADTPYRGVQPGPAPDAPRAPVKVACVACEKEVLLGSTYMLPDGPTCEDCYLKR